MSRACKLSMLLLSLAISMPSYALLSTLKPLPQPHKVAQTPPRYGVKGADLQYVNISNKVSRYKIKGKRYTTLNKEDSRKFTQTGVASYYGGSFHGRKTASGEIFNKNAYTAAHKTLALGTYLLVTHLQNGKQVIVRINDRGPFSKDRILDLSVASAKALNMLHAGIGRVKIEAIHVEPDGYLTGKGVPSLYSLAKKAGIALHTKKRHHELLIKAQ